MRYLLIILSLLSFSFNQEIEWNQSLLPGISHSAKQTMDNGYILTGFANFSQYYDHPYPIPLIKTNYQGDIEWYKSILPHPSSDADGHKGNDVLQTLDGGYIVVGTEENICCWNLRVVKTNELGEIQWDYYLELPSITHRGYSVDLTNDGGYVISGESHGQDIANVILIKLNQFGEEEWKESFEFETVNGRSYIKSIVKLLIDSNYILASESYPFQLFKINENGEELWNFIFDETHSDNLLDNAELTSIAATSDGGCIVSCILGYGRFLIIKISSNGIQEWYKIIDGGEWGNGSAQNSFIQEIDDGYYSFLGQSYGGITYIAVLNNNGDIKGEGVIDFSDNQMQINSFEKTNDNQFIISGRINGNFYLIKLDSLIAGCVDQNATNFNEYAFYDNNSCIYPNELQPHYTTIWENQPNNPMAIYLNSVLINNQNWSPGDEIGVFDGELCVGAIMFDPVLDGILTIYNSENNSTTEEQNGFVAGNPIIFKYWDYSHQVEITDIVTIPEEFFFTPLTGLTVDLIVDAIYGCMDENACNYNENSTIQDECIYIEQYSCDCDGNILDECGECNGIGIPQGECDCNGNILDGCHICGGDNSTCSGCTHQYAINYDEDAIIDDGTCEYPETGDLNNDTIFNIQDIIIMVGYILNNEYVFYADLNEDNYLNVLDILILINIVLE